jgi:multidrug efflux pump
VSGPIIAIALVLCAVFVPIAFLSGVTGQFYRQFAVTIAISTVISAVNSLTLSPALAAVLLKPHGAPPDRLTRILNFLFGWLFRPFNRLFNRAAHTYAEGGRPALKRAPLMLAVYAVLIGCTVLMFRAVPGGFIPTQDKLYLIGGVKLPEGASLDRTEAAVRKMSDMALQTEGVTGAVQFPGLNPLQFTNTPNAGTVFFNLGNFEERDRPAPEIVGELMGKFSTIQEGFIFAIMPPAILGIGTGSGFSLYVQDRTGLGYGELQNAVMALSGALSHVPGMAFPITSYQANVPQLTAEVDRTKAKKEGLALTDVFETLQVYLGSAYVNDFTRFGRTYQVYAQADAPFRDET